MQFMRRELKVCEACGGLWVRTGIEAGVYCRECKAMVADLPGRRHRKPGRPCTVRRSGSAERAGVVRKTDVVRKTELVAMAGGVR